MSKRVLIIINPNAGMKKGNRFLTDIISIFNKQDFFTSVVTTKASGDAKKFSRENASFYDAVVAVGGDGTFNEVVSGLFESGVNIPVGYIPSGSTNDFATGIGLSKNILQAAKDITKNNIIKIDLGDFGGRIFTYVASFGAFTETSYNTSQSLKNSLGHLAYVLEGIKDVPSILRSEKMKITTDENEYEGSFVFGAVSNSTSLGGLLKLNKKYVDISDGKLELLVIRKPNTPIEYAQVIYALNSGEYEKCPLICFCSTASVKIEADKEVNWTLDGELERAKKISEVKNVPNAVQIFVP